jgi:alpha-D-xyloside xylohydrolase
MKTARLVLSWIFTTTIMAALHVRAAAIPVSSFSRDADGVTMKMKPGVLRLEVFSPAVIRVTYAPGEKQPSNHSLCVIEKPGRAHWKVSETKEDVILSTDELQARVNRVTGAVGFFDKNGKPVMAEESGGKSLVPNKVGGISTLRSTDKFELAPDEAIYGLGQHQQGVMNNVGHRVKLLQENREVAVPVLVSSRGYGVLWDNSAVTEVNVGTGQEETIPGAQLFDENGHPGGLTACYYRGDNFNEPVRTNVDAQVDHDWSKNPPADLPHDHYSVRWDGFVEADKSGDYTFAATADDGVRLWIDGKEVVNDWSARAAETFTAKVHFDANSRHCIRMEYFQYTGGAVARLAWQLPATNEAVTWSSEAADAIDYYFMYGPDLDQVISGYRELTGAAPMMAKWGWGFWQCKERYKSQQELLDVVARYRAMQVPLDGIIQDWQYWSPNPWGSHKFDTNRYPNPKEMMHELHTNHVHALISVWAKFDVGCSNAKELGQAGGLYPEVTPYVYPPGKGQWYDAFNPVARKIYWQQISRSLFADGFDGWWLDASEPELSGKWGEFRDFKTAAGPGANVFNAYPLEHTSGVYHGQRAESSAKRVFILTRSAWAGQQRNAAVTWSGDIQGNWDVFTKQIPAGLNFVASGIPYWNTDTGGFFGGDPEDPKYAELFTRWFQFSAFCPMFRVHGTGKPKEMWCFDTNTENILIRYDKLRYHLIPYIYSVSWMVTRGGYTMMRPLVMDFRSDTNVFDIPDQYLFGPALMPCPVTVAGATRRNVYLPSGTTWYDFWTGQTNAGGQTIRAAAPIDTLPLYVRAGSVIPYGPAIQYAMQTNNPIELRVYGGADGKFTLYEDEGDNYDYEKGKYATIPISWNEARHTLEIGKRKGEFPGMSKERTFNIVWVSAGHGVGMPSTEKPDAVVHYHGAAVKVSGPE